MKLKMIFLVLSIGLVPVVKAQTSIEAQKLLELASKKMESYDNISFEFSYVLNNRVEQINQENSGEVTVADEKYRLNFLDAIQLFDGKTLYTIVPENEEITLTEAEETEDFGINPKELLEFYKEGYDYHWDISQRVKGKKIQFVKLIPTQDDGGIKSLLIGIDTQENHIYKLIEVGDNGTITTLTINNMNVDNPLPENFFVFNASDYPNYYINN
ncbi:MAG: outer membrane lipoprotein carrier protein LolA [Bacteroidetes bacterium]|nr:outer membrane lipoprotein carrier protein LolA [Bacteroidota bacterium]MDA0935737.1 outer membrane lipoprotein carrier protein LolA [Bacteroidota bacterium]